MRRTASTVFAIASLLVIADAKAQSCSTEMLIGQYSVSFHGQVTGTLTGTPPTIMPFATPNLVDGIGTFDFDGSGNLEFLSLAVRNGAPAAAGMPGLTETGFQPQTGTYSVSSDCTGTGTISQPGMSVTFGLVIGDRGRKLRTLNTSAHVQTIPNNPNCTNGCELAIQISTVGEKVFERDR